MQTLTNSYTSQRPSIASKLLDHFQRDLSKRELCLGGTVHEHVCSTHPTFLKTRRSLDF